MLLNSAKLIQRAAFQRGALQNAGLQQCKAQSMSNAASSGPPGPPVYMVYGATGGIGGALAQRLARQPEAKLVLVGRDQEKLDKLQSELHPEASVTSAVADVIDAKQVEAAVKKAVDTYGRISGVANCTGSIVLRSAHATSDADFDQVMKVNLYSCFNILKPTVKSMMTTGGGSIAFCSSAVAKHGIPNHEAIAAAKAGIIGLCLSASATYAPKNIRVNCVAPGLTRGPGMSARITQPGSPALKASEAMHALKRVGEPEDVAAALEFFMHPNNSFITGQCLAVDGGLGSVKPQ
ncbi:hypothetical protein DUNSADRAFT_14272 [Dunaliella salina]|uniref:Ketoreductase domain-containing protein n=1 Tax=Dunaliella salina TaxID=3046 RepID=A0ABQ7G7M6_DUNSA|nr:hypothetical protein DUNSADRAFT_14272 [Dunaliella salina]|eukprot:KAF5830606.1 hypothetical protein DUNSADRAFT_14272 [Dunaliella salina]